MFTINHIDELFEQPGKVHQLSAASHSPFEEAYLAVRKVEGRLYPDDILRQLPEVSPDHPLFAEWQVRKDTLDRILACLHGKSRRLNILDLGCGNGWLSNRIAQNAGCRVCAVDLNREELAQGARVFADNPRLVFIYGDIFQPIFPKKSFDIILAASSIQYFPDIAALIRRLGEFIHAHGEIHIMDSPIYHETEVANAKFRTLRHYRSLGFAQMAQHYFHHTWDDLKPFHYHFLYKPHRFSQRLAKYLMRKNQSPFPWIRILPKNFT